MNLCINIGNHNVALGLFEASKLLNPVRIPLNELVDLRSVLPSKKLKHIIVSSVVPQKNDMFSYVLRAVYKVEPKFIIPNIIAGTYPSMGADRIANLLGGKNLMGLPVCVIDFGTATTIDVMDKNNLPTKQAGKYAGGLIMPGLEIGANALHKATALLPEIALAKLSLKELLQKSTKSCIEAGIYWGEYYRVKGIIEEIKNKFNPSFIVTGGAGEKIADALKLEYNPWLTLYGLIFN